MSQNIRRFAVALSLTMVLASTPAMAAPARDGSRDERGVIARVIHAIQKFFGIRVTEAPIIPIP